jgi:hypothetical protein
MEDTYFVTKLTIPNYHASLDVQFLYKFAQTFRIWSILKVAISKNDLRIDLIKILEEIKRIPKIKFHNWIYFFSLVNNEKVKTY